MTANQTNTLATLVEQFAKANKVSREKLTTLAADIIETVPVIETVRLVDTVAPVVKTRSRAKREAQHQFILAYAKENGGTFTRAGLAKAGLKSVAFATDTLEECGLIVRLDSETKVTAGVGRGSVTYKIATSVG